MWIDLHCHSHHSDGTDPPEQVTAMAAERGVELFCLTDHDTTAGYRATVGACTHVLRGLELSCSDHGRTVHVLVYDAARDDERWRALERQLDSVREARRNRLRAIAERLAQLGVVIEVESMIERAGARSVGRPDIADALVEVGVVSNVQEAFDRFLSDRGSAHVPLSRLSLADGLRIGLEAGARMSLAHPHTLGRDAQSLLVRYRASGLEGLECYYGSYTDMQRRKWLALARAHKLVVTGGSDFHGKARPQFARPGVNLPHEHAHELMDWLML